MWGWEGGKWKESQLHRSQGSAPAHDHVIDHHIRSHYHFLPWHSCDNDLCPKLGQSLLNPTPVVDLQVRDALWPNLVEPKQSYVQRGHRGRAS